MIAKVRIFAINQLGRVPIRWLRVAEPKDAERRHSRLLGLTFGTPELLTCTVALVDKGSHFWIAGFSGEAANAKGKRMPLKSCVVFLPAASCFRDLLRNNARYSVCF